MPLHSDRSIDYDAFSPTYDEVRAGNSAVIDHIIELLEPDERMMVLDVGCGTGNHTVLFRQKTGSVLIGIDISRGMLTRALSKDLMIEFIQARAEGLPFTDDIFDIALMIEIIHHLQDLELVIREVRRVLKDTGRLCIVTQSHQQIEERMTSQFFPATEKIEKSRYPTIASIKRILSLVGLDDIKVSTFSIDVVIGEDFLETVSKKGFSMLHLISQDEFMDGLDRARRTIDKNEPIVSKLGYSIVIAR